MAATSHGIQVVERERVETPPREERTATTVPATGAAGPGTVPAVGLGTLGILTLLVGAWGGIVPFVGSIFGFSADGSVSWYWSLPHALLWLAPGAAAVVAGLMMLGLMPRAAIGFGRSGAFGAGMLAVLAGAWFVIGPLSWPALQRSAGVFMPAGPMHMFADMVGYSFGPGVLLVLFGGLALGMAGRRRRVPAAEGVAGRRPAGGTGRPVTA
ncbi:MAG: hypothetical protein ACYDA2_05525 [Acidimicrobiales bacterium]